MRSINKKRKNKKTVNDTVRDTKTKPEPNHGQSWWQKIDFECVAKSSLNFIREIHGLPRVRYVKNPIHKPINLWLTYPHLRMEKFPEGSVEIVQFIQNRNRNNQPFTSNDIVKGTENIISNIISGLPLAISQKFKNHDIDAIEKLIENLLEKRILTNDIQSSEYTSR